MSTAPAQANPYNRVISLTVAVLSLVLGAPPLIGIVVHLVVRILHRQHGMPSVLILPAVGLIGISITILRGLRRREVFDWMGGGRLNYLLVLLIPFLGLMLLAEIWAIEHLMVSRLGVRAKVANVLAFLPVIAGGLVFAFYWRRASAARVLK